MQRRSVIKTLAGALIVPALPLNFPFSDSHLTDHHPANRHLAAPVLRVAHLTDVHLKDEWDAPAHYRACLHHVQSQQPKVDLILNGGDIVFDINKENLDNINAQWQLTHSIMKAECSLPVYYTLGNHDIWWNEADKGQALYGKKYSLDQLGLTTPYYSFEKGGWKFIVLDSVHLDIDGTWYIGKLGNEQFQWLQGQLQATPSNMPVCVLSHIPILTATNLIEDDIVNKWEMTGGDMHTDTAKIISLFYKYPNVRLCLSGHIHLREKLVYNDVTYVCDGAVSGAWWKGNRRETAPGYGLLDLYADGTFNERYVQYK